MSTFRSLYSNGLTIRRTGSAALDMANVAAGRLDGFLGSGLGMWDICWRFISKRGWRIGKRLLRKSGLFRR